jgi:hypothetical protein
LYCVYKQPKKCKITLVSLGVSAIGIFTVAIVWAMEVVSGKWKTFFGIFISLAWAAAKYAYCIIYI